MEGDFRNRPDRQEGIVLHIIGKLRGPFPAMRGVRRIGAAGADQGVVLRGDSLGHVPVVELDVADRCLHVGGRGLDRKPAGQSVAGAEIQLEVVANAGLVHDVDVRTLVDGADRWQALLVHDATRDREIRVAADVVDRGEIGQAEPELPLALGILGKHAPRAGRPGKYDDRKNRNALR